MSIWQQVRVSMSLLAQQYPWYGLLQRIVVLHAWQQSGLQLLHGIT